MSPQAAPGGTPVPFSYVVMRIVPRVDRGEFVNGSVLLYCQVRGFLDAAVRTDLTPVSALDSSCELQDVRALLEGLTAAARGRGPAGALALGARFQWLAAPRSSTIQPGPIHTGMTRDPAAELAHLATCLL
jgi:hypothetical protein